MADRKSRAGLFVGLGVVAALAASLAVFQINPLDMVSSGGPVEAEAAQKAVAAPIDKTGDFMARVLGSTEDFWAEEFKERRLPTYGAPAPAEYRQPTLVLYDDVVSSGCDVIKGKIAGPLYCMPDHKLYIDPQFYEELDKGLHAPGDFAQAVVIAHEVGHHVQDLIGAGGGPRTESENRQSVRFELQADCFAGAWAHAADVRKHQIEPGDIDEGLTALTNIGDDVLMRTSAAPADPARFTHGSGEQRVRWFKRGHAGDARDCDTFALAFEAL